MIWALLAALAVINTYLGYLTMNLVNANKFKKAFWYQFACLINFIGIIILIGRL